MVVNTDWVAELDPPLQLDFTRQSYELPDTSPLMVVEVPLTLTGPVQEETEVNLYSTRYELTPEAAPQLRLAEDDVTELTTRFEGLLQLVIKVPETA